jgi:hypothetical protein
MPKKDAEEMRASRQTRDLSNRISNFIPLALFMATAALVVLSLNTKQEDTDRCSKMARKAGFISAIYHNGTCMVDMGEETYIPLDVAINIRGKK